MTPVLVQIHMADRLCVSSVSKYDFLIASTRLCSKAKEIKVRCGVEMVDCSIQFLAATLNHVPKVLIKVHGPASGRVDTTQPLTQDKCLPLNVRG